MEENKLTVLFRATVPVAKCLLVVIKCLIRMNMPCAKLRQSQWELHREDKEDGGIIF